MARDITITLKAVDEYSDTLGKFKTDVGNIGTSTRDMASSSQKAGSALDSVGAGITGAIAAYAGWKGIQLVGDMVDLGQQVSIVNQTFEALTEKIGGAETNLKKLRIATGGTVDDLTLLQGANKLLQMGLVDTTDELTDMESMAVKLGSSMGMDATKSMSDFSLMLANNSIMRLDQFGISSSDVRTRMAELKETMEGIDKSEAFKLAVLEIGKKALDRLGDAATAAETPLNRVATTVKNLVQSFTEDLSIGANSIVGILEILTGNNPIQKQQKEEKKVEQQDFVTTYGTMFQKQAAEQGIDLTALFGTQENIDTAFKGMWDSFKTGGVESIESVSTSINGMTYQLSGMTDEKLPALMKTILEKYIADQQKVIEDAALAAAYGSSPEGLYEKYLTTGDMGDDRPHGAVDVGLGASLDNIMGSDLANKDLKPSEITSQMAIDIQAINKDAEGAGKHIDRIELALTKGAGMAEKIKNALDHLKTSQQITIHWSSDDPSGIVPVIKAVLGGGVDLAAAMANATRDNGGVPPGSTGDQRRNR